MSGVSIIGTSSTPLILCLYCFLPSYYASASTLLIQACSIPPPQTSIQEGDLFYTTVIRHLIGDN